MLRITTGRHVHKKGTAHFEYKGVAPTAIGYPTSAPTLLPPSKRVTSATCEDGCATATSGANRQARSRARSRHRTIPRLLQPRFPDPNGGRAPSRSRQPEFEAQPPDEPEGQEPQPMAEAGAAVTSRQQQLRRDRNRRRGRRGRGSRPQPSQPPRYPRSGWSDRRRRRSRSSR